MKTIVGILILWSGLSAAYAQAIREAEIIEVEDAEELQDLLSGGLDFVEIRLAPGQYHLKPREGTDPTCVHCEQPEQEVPITVGVMLTGVELAIVGPEDRSAVIHTNAGYGLYFFDCEDCRVENLTITGGKRDTSARAGDAAIVIQRSTVTVRNNLIRDNIGDSAIVARTTAGIMGICGREESLLIATENDIIRNSWDGIALYRGARARIAENVIDGVDKAATPAIGGGRGVGIGLNRNASAQINANLVKRYGKGIGIFVDAEAIVRNNIVEDIAGWGMALWDAGQGTPVGIFQRNIVYNTGACGALIHIDTAHTEQPGMFIENLLLQTGRTTYYTSDLYCPQCALATPAVSPDFRIENNLLYNNGSAAAECSHADLDDEAFRAALPGWLQRINKRTHLSSSDFAVRFSQD